MIFWVKTLREGWGLVHPCTVWDGQTFVLQGLSNTVEIGSSLPLGPELTSFL